MPWRCRAFPTRRDPAAPAASSRALRFWRGARRHAGFAHLYRAFGTSLLWRRYHTHESTGGTGPDPPARIPKIRPGQLSISGLVDISTSCRGGWIKDNGGLSPIALCGLTSLYSVRHSSTFSPASSRSRNQWRPRHSSRTVALKWPDSRKSVRSFKGIICDNISEFESYMPSHAVRSPWAVSALQKCATCPELSPLPAGGAAVVGIGGVVKVLALQPRSRSLWARQASWIELRFKSLTLVCDRTTLAGIRHQRRPRL
jgi:hypothetical protein